MLSVTKIMPHTLHDKSTFNEEINSNYLFVGLSKFRSQILRRLSSSPPPVSQNVTLDITEDYV